MRNPTLLLSAAILSLSSAAASAQSSWENAGKGRMSDFVISSVFAEIPEQTFDVDWERDSEREGVYRIAEPYAAYVNLFEESLDYSPERATPMTIHVEENGAVWFERFNTGFRLGADEIYAGCAMEEKVGSVGFEEAFRNWPEAFGKYDGGIVGWKTMYMDGKWAEICIRGEFPTIIDDATGKGTVKIANLNDAFYLVFPDTEDNPDYGWETIDGKALFTDDIMASFFDLYDYQSMEVEIQRNKADRSRFRLVNPYAEWISPFSNVTYDSGTPRYLVFDMFETADGIRAYVHRTFTGVMGEGFGEIWFYSQIRPFVILNAWTLAQLGEWYPDAFGLYNPDTREIRFAFSYDYGGSPHDTFLINPTASGFYSGNLSESFCIKMPLIDDSGIENIMGSIDNTSNTEYYTLQGIRIASPSPGEIVIRRQGGKTDKIVF